MRCLTPSQYLYFMTCCCIHSEPPGCVTYVECRPVWSPDHVLPSIFWKEDHISWTAFSFLWGGRINHPGQEINCLDHGWDRGSLLTSFSLHILSAFFCGCRFSNIYWSSCMLISVFVFSPLFLDTRHDIIAAAICCKEHNAPDDIVLYYYLESCLKEHLDWTSNWQERCNADTLITPYF